MQNYHVWEFEQCYQSECMNIPVFTIVGFHCVLNGKYLLYQLPHVQIWRLGPIPLQMFYLWSIFWSEWSMQWVILWNGLSNVNWRGWLTEYLQIRVYLVKSRIQSYWQELSRLIIMRIHLLLQVRYSGLLTKNKCR